MLWLWCGGCCLATLALVSEGLLVCYALRGVGGVQYCLLGSWVVYLCVVDVVLSSIVVVLQVLIAIVYQSVWAYIRSEWVDPRSVVRMGWWDHGEISSHLFTLVAIHWCWGVSGSCITCIDWVEVMERRKCGVTSLETAQGSWSACLCDDDLWKGSKHVMFFVLLICHYYLLDSTRPYIPVLCLTFPLCLFY
jgi:hypothetical protein